MGMPDLSCCSRVPYWSFSGLDEDMPSNAVGRRQMGVNFIGGSHKSHMNMPTAYSTVIGQAQMGSRGFILDFDFYVC